MKKFPEETLDKVNALLGGFNQAMGLRFVRVSPEEFVAELEVGNQHLQPYGLVHGGVYSGMIETVCSTAAAMTVFNEKKSAVGLENTTSFLKAVRSGKITCTVKPTLIGKRTHVWTGTVTDDRNRLVATGRVRLMILEDGAEAGGETVRLKV